MRWLRRLWRGQLRVLNSQTAYAAWSKNYPAEAHNPLMHIEETAMRDLMPDLRGLCVLDVACGTGRYGQIARENGAARVLGIDNSEPMLRAGRPGTVAVASSEALPLLSGSVNVILCGMALGHLPDSRPSLAEMGRVLRLGGTALISDFHPVQHYRGAQRTFRDEAGKVYAVEHHPHLTATLLDAANSAGLRLRAMREPTHDDLPVVRVMRFERVNGQD